jgi:hypothetical protein
MPVKPRWHTSTSTSEISTNNIGVTLSLPFSPNFPINRAPVAIFYHGFIPVMATARNSPMMML